MGDLWTAAVTADFWERCGLDDARVPYPRDLTEPLLWGTHALDIEHVPDLRLHHVEEYARAFNLSVRIDGADRRLRACVLAWRGQGFILIDAADPPEERRFSLAHEVAHYLCEYDAPRQSCIARMGDAILPVLDGHRPPTGTERANALLAGVTLGTHAHFMEREAASTATDTKVEIAEQRADSLALALLAPAEDAWAVISRDPRWPRMYAAARKAHAQASLQDTFGLPAPVARRYATELLARYQPGQSVREWLNV